jgi:integrase
MNAFNVLDAPQSAGPTVEIGKVVPPVRRKDTRKRKHLTPSEVAALLAAARRSGRYRHRDETAVLLAYRHGMRAVELVSLEWSQVDLKGGTVTLWRAKGGKALEHPLRGVEIRALRRLRTEQPDARFVFLSERGGPMTTGNYRAVLRRLAKAAGAKVEITVNPHALRHACGYYLASRGVDTRALSHYLGHRSLQSSERYTELSAHRFRDFWRD